MAVKGNEDLNVRITASNKQLLTSVNRAEKRLRMMERNAEKSMRKVRQEFKKTGDSAGFMGRAMSVAVGSLTAALSAASLNRIRTAFRAMTDSMDVLGKTSVAINVSTRALQEWRLAAELGGVEGASVQRFFTRLSKAASDASDGLNTYVRAFTRLGVSYKTASGQLRGAEEIMLDLAAAYDRAVDKTQAVADIQAIMGTRANALLPAFKSMAAAQKEAAAFYTAENIKRAEEANDRVTIALRHVAGSFQNVAVEALEATASVLEWISAARQANVEARGQAFQAQGMQVQVDRRAAAFVGPPRPTAAQQAAREARARARKGPALAAPGAAKAKSQAPSVRRARTIEDEYRFQVRQADRRARAALADEVAAEKAAEKAGGGPGALEGAENIGPTRAMFEQAMANRARARDRMESDRAGGVADAFLRWMGGESSGRDLIAESFLEWTGGADAGKQFLQGLFKELFAGLGGPGDAGGFGGLIGGGIRSIFGFQSGGLAFAGRPALVGERGPEIFVPSHTGRVHSNAASARMGGGVTVQQNFTIQSTDGPGVRAALAQAMPQIREQTKAAVVADLRRPSASRTLAQGS